MASWPSREKFERQYVREPDSGCWLWTGRTNGRYGVMWGGRVNGKSVHVYAHRYSYGEYVAPIPDGALICHKCDNPLCVNPGHLYAGDARSNMLDRVERNSNHPISRGSAHWNARLTEADVRRIREWRGSSVVMAAEFGVNARQIRKIRQGARWGGAA